MPWRGSATFARLDAFARGVVEGLSVVLAHGHPLVLVGDGDVGGLTGILISLFMIIVGARVLSESQWRNWKGPWSR